MARFIRTFSASELAVRPKEAAPAPEQNQEQKTPEEKGGPPGPEPTRYGDWEKNGKCVDF